MIGTLRERFEAKYELDDLTGCWLWTSTKRKSGKAIISLTTSGKKRSDRSARLIGWELYNGPLASGWYLKSSCELDCVNPNHCVLIEGPFSLTYCDTCETMQRESRAHPCRSPRPDTHAA